MTTFVGGDLGFLGFAEFGGFGGEDLTEVEDLVAEIVFCVWPKGLFSFWFCPALG